MNATSPEQRRTKCPERQGNLSSTVCYGAVGKLVCLQGGALGLSFVIQTLAPVHYTPGAGYTAPKPFAKAPNELI